MLHYFWQLLTKPFHAKVIEHYTLLYVGQKWPILEIMCLYTIFCDFG